MAPTGQHICTICTPSRSFTRRYTWLRHMESLHYRKDTYKCTFDNCNEQFSRSDVLERHWLNQHGIGKVECTNCGKSIRRNALQEHQQGPVCRWYTANREMSFHSLVAFPTDNNKPPLGSKLYGSNPDNCINPATRSVGSTISSSEIVANVHERVPALDPPSNNSTPSSGSDMNSLSRDSYPFTELMESLPNSSEDQYITSKPNMTRSAQDLHSYSLRCPFGTTDMNANFHQTASNWQPSTSLLPESDCVTEGLQVIHEVVSPEMYSYASSTYNGQNLCSTPSGGICDKSLSRKSMESVQFDQQNLRSEPNFEPYEQIFTGCAIEPLAPVGAAPADPLQYEANASFPIQRVATSLSNSTLNNGIRNAGNFNSVEGLSDSGFPTAPFQMETSLNTSGYATVAYPPIKAAPAATSNVSWPSTLDGGIGFCPEAQSSRQSLSPLAIPFVPTEQSRSRVTEPYMPPVAYDNALYGTWIPQEGSSVRIPPLPDCETDSKDQSPWSRRPARPLNSFRSMPSNAWMDQETALQTESHGNVDSWSTTHTEQLDSRYRTRSLEFKVARVFRVLWSEPSSDRQADSEFPAVTTNVPSISPSSLNRRIRRFVIVRHHNQQGTFEASPSKTYTGRGVAASGVVKSHHSIIYTSSPSQPRLEEQSAVPPWVGPDNGGQVRPMQWLRGKEPDDRRNALDPMSRLDFSTCYDWEIERRDDIWENNKKDRWANNGKDKTFAHDNRHHGHKTRGPCRKPNGLFDQLHGDMEPSIRTPSSIHEVPSLQLPASTSRFADSAIIPSLPLTHRSCLDDMFRPAISFDTCKDTKLLNQRSQAHIGADRLWCSVREARAESRQLEKIALLLSRLLYAICQIYNNVVWACIRLESGKIWRIGASMLDYAGSQTYQHASASVPCGYTLRSR